MNDKLIEKTLSDAFLKILEKHNNPEWSYKELNWLVFDKYKNEFYNLSQENQWNVRHFMDALYKIHGK